ncbi:hypothetical protein FGO68_gene4947 [Halteria grandinella]|uniref:Uncharacterized protein n=1 Tax=Halteria grandinella TaxID=5974 RepID=A0A8J8NU17_HALGN|nr:hypothetical protein FGO68_gene4947 [Halteria grandinella]
MQIYLARVLLLEKNPHIRPNIKSILQNPVIKSKIIEIYEQEDQKVPKLRMQEESKDTFEKDSVNIAKIKQPQEYQPHNLINPIGSRQIVQNGLNQFLQQIREIGYDSLVDAALLHGISLDQSQFSGLEDRVNYEDLEPGIYYGQHVNGQRDGFGILFTTKEGVPYLYECEWTKGAPTKGRFIWSSNNKWGEYEGEFDEIYQMAGIGKYSYYDGDTYQGQFKRNLMNGYGKFKFSNGDIYEGKWKDDNKVGIGKYRWHTGDVYEGLYKDDKMHGLGRYTYASGNYTEGQWQNGKRVGEHKQYSSEGKHLQVLLIQMGQLSNKGKHWKLNDPIYN